MDYFITIYNSLNANQEHYVINLNIIDMVVNDYETINYSDNYLDFSFNISILANRVVIYKNLISYNYKNSADRLGNCINYIYTSASYVKQEGVYLPSNELGITSNNYISYDNNLRQYGINFTIDTWYDDNQQLSDAEYQTIYNDGYEDGYSNGLTDGFQNGINANNQEFTGVFGLLGTAFDSAGGLMNTNVIGGLTIGTFVMIPLAITVIVAILKLIRK